MQWRNSFDPLPYGKVVSNEKVDTILAQATSLKYLSRELGDQ